MRGFCSIEMWLGGKTMGVVIPTVPAQNPLDPGLSQQSGVVETEIITVASAQNLSDPSS